MELVEDALSFIFVKEVGLVIALLVLVNVLAFPGSCYEPEWLASLDTCQLNLYECLQHFPSLTNFVKEADALSSITFSHHVDCS